MTNNNKEWEEDYTIFNGGVLIRNDRLRFGGIIANEETKRSVEEILQKERQRINKEWLGFIKKQEELGTIPKGFSETIKKIK